MRGGPILQGDTMRERRGFGVVVLGVAVLVGWAYLAAPLRAAVRYQYITDQPNYTASGPGATVTVSLYLQEVLTGGSTSLIVANHGMGGAGVVDQRVSFTGATPTTIASISANM